jgi:hypothetical protein
VKGDIEIQATPIARTRAMDTMVSAEPIGIDVRSDQFVWSEYV